MMAPEQIPTFSPARSIWFLGAVECDFPEDHIEIALNFTIGKINSDFVTQLLDHGWDLYEAGELTRGENLYVEYRGTTSTADLMRPHAFATALILTSDVAVYPGVHVIVEPPHRTTGARLPIHKPAFRWGHSQNRLKHRDVAAALALYEAIERVRLTDRYHRVGNALLFYQNGYNTENPDLALVSFTTCIEGLFSTVEQEISFRLALRLAQFLADSAQQRREKFEQCREVYKVRSKIVHGASVMKNSEAAAIYLVEAIVPRAERLARSALRRVFELHLESMFDHPNKVDALFDELLFSDSLGAALAKINTPC